MNDKLIRAFDMCVAELEHAASVEEALGRNPGLAEELRPLLQTLVRTQSALSSIQPPAGVQAASRARFLQQAETKLSGLRAPAKPLVPAEETPQPGSLPQAGRDRRGRTPIRVSRPPAPGAGFLGGLLPLLTSRTATLFAALAIVVLAGVGVVNASAKSLPGTPLYGIKRMVENTQLVLSPSEESRARLEGKFSEQHSEEARQVTKQGWTVPLEFGGNLEAMEGTRWSVAGVIVIIPAGTTIRGEPEIGVYVNVRGTAQPDRTVLASQINIEGIIFQGRVDEIETEFWRIDGKTIFTSDATSIEGKPQPGDLVEVNAMTLSDGNLLAQTIRLIAPGAPRPDSGPQSEPQEDRGGNPDVTQTPGVEDSQTETAEPTRPSGSDDNLSPTLESTGVSGDDGHSGKTPEPSRTPSPKNEGGLAPTETPHSGGDSKPIEPTRTPEPPKTQAPTQTPSSGGSTANPTSSSPVKTKFQGVLQAIGGDTWLVAGQSVLVTAATAVEDNPAVGDNVEVEANVQADGSLVATRIRVKK